MKKILKIILIIIGIIYVIGVLYFSFFTFPKTMINGENEGLVKKTDLNNTDYSDYSLEIVGKDEKNDIIFPEEIDFEVVSDSKIDLNQNAFLWIFNIFSKHEYKIDNQISYSEEKLKDRLKNSDLNKDIVKTENAKVELVDGEYKIIPEVEGNELEQEKLEKSVINAFNFKKSELKLDEEYKIPKIKKDSKKLKEELELKNKLNKAKLTFDFDDRKEELAGEDLIALYDVDGEKFTVNKDKVTEYVMYLGGKYDTFGQDKKFVATGKGEITVNGGIYGWQIDVAETTNLITEKLEAGEGGTIEPVYKLKGLSRKTDDIGNTYVEIDLTRQHLWYYQDGKEVISTGIISGLPQEGRETPTGVFKIWSRETNRDLEGEDYSSPVKYWLPINWTGVGLHDASWQESFGGDLYKTLGSRGCINMPLEEVKKLYEMVKIDTPVVVYK